MTSMNMNNSEIQIVPGAHWHNLGYSAFYSQTLMQELQKVLLSWIRILRISEPSVIRVVQCYDEHGNRGDRFPNNSNRRFIRADHDDILLPEWQAFCDALHDSRTVNVDLHILNIELSGSVLDMIYQALVTKYMNKLELQNIGFGKRTIEFVVRVLNENPTTLTSLNLSSNNLMTNSDDTEYLFSTISSRTTLDTISLDGCKVGESLKLLASVMNGAADVKCISLQNNNLGPEGAHLVADVLKKNPKITRMQLCGNKMKDEGIGYLSDALRTNTNLREIDVSQNGLTEVGKQALLKTVLDTSSLNAVVDSNHTCQIHLEEMDDLLIFANQLTICSSKESKMRKVSFTLGTSNDIGLEIPYLSDVPLELMPNVLNFVQKAVFTERRHSGAVALKNVFVIMRNCVTPLLCETEGNKVWLQHR